jgi:hypothetical protein
MRPVPIGAAAAGGSTSGQRDLRGCWWVAPPPRPAVEPGVAPTVDARGSNLDGVAECDASQIAKPQELGHRAALSRVQQRRMATVPGPLILSNLAARQQRRLDRSPFATRLEAPDRRAAFRPALRKSRKIMADTVKTTQVQQIAGEWEKFVASQMSHLESFFGEMAKLENKGITHLVGTWEDAGRYAKESLAQAERVSTEWRKLALEAARRTAQAVTQKQPS